MPSNPDPFVASERRAEPPPLSEPSALPTNKVIAAALTAAALFVISRFTEVDKDIEQLVIALAPLVAAWLTTNARTPGGVPLK